MRARPGPGASARASGTRTVPAAEARSASAYRAEMASESPSAPARSSVATSRTGTVPSPSRRPPTRSATACAVRGPAVTRSGTGLELLDDPRGQIERFVGSDDAAVGGAHVEDHGVVPRGPQSFDHGVDLGLDRLQQLALPGRGLLLQLLGPLLQLVLLAFELLPLGLPLGRAQHHGLLLEVRGRRVHAGLQL